ncbi:MAG: MFS transporter [Candidatus Lokiarchaeota archaeon]|nr:MFS transporter [Candidatus Lokiarchaeota archaeon]
MASQSNLNNRKIFKYANLTPLWIAVFIDIIGFSMILPMAPFIAQEFNIAIFIMGIVLSVNAMFSFIFGPILGKLSDKFGRKPLLLISQAGTFVGFIMLAFSNSIWILIISRIVDGVFGGNFPIAKAIVGDEVPPKDRGIQMANIGVAHVLASLIGPGLGGILFSIGGILLPGLFAAGLSLFTMIITIFILNETWPKEKRELNHELKKTIVIDIRKNKNAMWYLTLWGFHTASFMIAMSALSFFAQIVFGVNAFEIGILLMITGIFRALVRFTLFKPTIMRLGENNAIKLGLGFFLVAFLIIGFSINLLMFFILTMVISFAASLTRGPLNSKISQSVSPMEQGKINGYSSGLDSFAQIIGPLTSTFMLQFYAPYFLSFLISSVALVPFLMGFKTIQLKKYQMPQVIQKKSLPE